MRAFCVVLVTALQGHLISASPHLTASSFNVGSSVHDTDLMARADSPATAPLDVHDRGVWTLNCANAASACNNACWSINCLGQDTKKMYFDPKKNNKQNRKDSGCDAGGSVCNMMPFSQAFNDPKNLQISTCDEWPMADVKQDSRGGIQLRQFLDLKVNRPGRRGTQAFRDGDFWTVEFEKTEGAPYCNAKKGEDSCKNDGDQFEASYTGTKVSHPYNYEVDNRYRRNGDTAYSLVDIAQCRVHLRRERVPKNRKKRSAAIGPLPPSPEREISFEAEVFDHLGESKGTESDVPTEDVPIIVTGLMTDLKIWSTGDSIEDEAWYRIEGVDKDWKSEYEGVAGRYCEVGDVDGENGTKDEDCYFPCFVPKD
ncbi:MAG: hypothetical protein Q9174_004160 [Haloplaca sp. 1 TL-2023]